VRVVQDAPANIVIRLGGSIVQRERLGSLVHLIPGPHLENTDIPIVEVRIALSRSAGFEFGSGKSHTLTKEASPSYWLCVPKIPVALYMERVLLKAPPMDQVP
jgi:hypothetical protein